MMKRTLTYFLWFVVLLNAADTFAQAKVPQALRLKSGLMPTYYGEKKFRLDTVRTTKPDTIFGSCSGSSFYLAFQLSYNVGAFSTEVLDSVKVDFTFLDVTNPTVPILSKVIQVSVKTQTFMVTEFAPSAVTCNSNLRLRFNSVSAPIAVPLNQVTLSVIKYKVPNQTFVPTASYNVSALKTAQNVTVSWNSVPAATIAHDIEWVFIDSCESFSGTPAQAFDFKTAARVTVSAQTFNHLVYYPTGKIYYRVRTIGYNAAYPDHRIPGDWRYPATFVNVTNHARKKNWQVQTSFVEEGKLKKLVNYADGTLRTRQSVTNLSTENLVMIHETGYDYEGRASIQVLPAPASDDSLSYHPSFNKFKAINNTVSTYLTAHPNTVRFHYDNQGLANSIIDSTTVSGASNYYSGRTGITGTMANYLPRSKGYVYSQTSYVNEPMNRPKGQAGVGYELRTDGKHGVLMYYGTAAPAEIARLFGSNAGNATHYRKYLTKDQNGQTSVSYHDQTDRIVATALTGSALPSNVVATKSYTDTPSDSLFVDLTSENKDFDSVRTITHRILNAVPTQYKIRYGLYGKGANVDNFGCVTCSFDVVITISKPDGTAMNLLSLPGNQSSDTTYKSFVHKNISAASCATASVDKFSFVVNLDSAGDYTVTKKLIAHNRTFTDVKAYVSSLPAVSAQIAALQTAYVVDPSKCNICRTDSTGIINDAITSLSKSDCDNYLQRIRDALVASHSSDPNYVPSDTDIKNHPNYCQYTLCQATTASAQFDMSLALVSGWKAAQAKGYGNSLMSFDPFFADGGKGAPFAANMVTLLNNITIGTFGVNTDGNASTAESTKTLSGSITAITDSTNTNYYINSNGVISATGYHILYYDLMNRYALSQITLSEYKDKFDKQRWLIYKSFYLECKRKLKLSIPEYANCSAAVAELKTSENMPTDPNQVQAWGNTFPYALGAPVSDPEVQSIVLWMASTCLALTSADQSTITTNLTSYFNANPSNIFRVILSSDSSNPYVVNINSVLSSRGCSISSFYGSNPYSCSTSVTRSYLLPHNYTTPAYVFGTAINCSPVVNQSGCSSSTTLPNVTGSLTTFAPAQNEYDALLKLYQSLGGSGWTAGQNTGWSTAAAGTPVCVYGWSGVTTNANGNVIGLNLSAMNVSGTLPAEIGNLTYLQSLTITSSAGLSGILPETIGNLFNLINLNISGTSIVGAIPSSIGKLSAMTALTLSANQLTGAIPRTIGTANALTVLDLSTNLLTDSIPSAIGDLASLVRLNLSHNQLIGGLSSHLSGFTCNSCTEINLQYNNLQGPLPAKFKNIYKLYVNNNNFSASDLAPVVQNWNTPSSPPNFSSQNRIDQNALIDGVVGTSITLNAAIDRTSSPASSYQWFKGTTSLGAPSTTGYNYTIASPATGDAGAYHYVVTNSSLGSLSLVSNDITMNVCNGSCPRYVTYCAKYDSVALAKYLFYPNWSAIVQKCLDSAARERLQLISYATNRILDSVASQYYRKANCLSNTTDSLSYNALFKEYQYNLYFYDQSGQLVQTIAPEGVVPLSTADTKKVLAGIPIYPAHRMPSSYYYSSLNKISMQSTPDGGTSNFWYDSKTQLRMSQNAQQALDQHFSYVKYDALTRAVESGEIYTSAGSAALVAQLDDTTFPLSTSYTLKDVANTFYDAPCSSLDQNRYPQTYLRNRVSWTEMHEKDVADTIVTYYSYDIHGNVSSIYQHIPKMKLKRIDYMYDLVSGNVNYVSYQQYRNDQFYHHYTYDADNRLQTVQTSTDAYLWDTDATYSYYKHGPLARLELGEYYHVQGLDYLYTLQGWLKGVNMPFQNDPNGDGYSGNKTGKDAFSFTIGYYKNDYAPIGGGAFTDKRDKVWTQFSTVYSGNNGLYNGNISWMVTDLKKIGQQAGSRVKGVQAMLYQYDQINRIRTSRSLSVYSATTGFSRSGTPYDEDFTYDNNGNLLTAQRKDGTSAIQDNLAYSYYKNTNRLYAPQVYTDTTYSGVVNSNTRLNRNIQVLNTASMPSSGSPQLIGTTLIDFTAGHFPATATVPLRATVTGAYQYDANGNIISDKDQKVQIEWTPSGKVRKVTKADGSVLSFRYNANGQRIERKLVNGSGTQITRYLVDATGEHMAIYNDTVVVEQYLYGTEKLGSYLGGRAAGVRRLGRKNYPLYNHLSNVLTVVSDNIRLTADSAWADINSATDFYAFGSSMTNRSYSLKSYRYSFNGKEKDDSGFGATSYDYGFRIYEPRIGRFLSVDPLFKGYPMLSPYQFAGNSPIESIDLDGLERLKVGKNGDWEMYAPTDATSSIHNPAPTKPTPRLPILRPPPPTAFIGPDFASNAEKNERRANGQWNEFIRKGQERDPFMFGGQGMGMGFARTMGTAIEQTPYMVLPEIAIGKLSQVYRGYKIAQATEIATTVERMASPVERMATPTFTLAMKGNAGSMVQLTEEAAKGGFSLTRHGELTNGIYTVSTEAMKKHVFGGIQGRSVFYPTLNANAAVLKAAEYADEAGLWIGNKAKVPILNTNIGTLGNGQPTNVINVYRNSKGFIHGSPGSIR